MTGRWAATNTLREALDYMEVITLALGPGERTEKLAEARASVVLVEAELDAAEKFEQGGINLSNVEFDQAATALAAALRAVREGRP